MCFNNPVCLQGRVVPPTVLRVGGCGLRQNKEQLLVEHELKEDTILESWLIWDAGSLTAWFGSLGG